MLLLPIVLLSNSEKDLMDHHSMDRVKGILIQDRDTDKKSDRVKVTANKSGKVEVTAKKSGKVEVTAKKSGKVKVTTNKSGKVKVTAKKSGKVKVTAKKSDKDDKPLDKDYHPKSFKVHDQSKFPSLVRL